MIAPAFTPGPWGIFASSKERGTQVRASLGDGNFNTICYALRGDADGRLIAAAPELYEAALLVVNDPGSAANLEILEAALAKARGE